MTMRTTTRRSILSRCTATATAAILGVAALTVGAHDARADEVSPTGKGITGGALLGAEAVTIVESLAGVQKPWLFVLGAVGGAAAGGVGGYFVEQGSSDGRVPVYMLAGGLALIIPAVVLTLNATRYHPDEGAAEDKGAPTEIPADPGATGGSSVGAPAGGSPAATPPAPPPSSTPAPATPPGGPQGKREKRERTPAVIPDSLVQLSVGPVAPTELRVGVPVPNVRPMWSLNEQRQYGLQQGTELRLPVVRVTF
jgi:hypothetical protein